MTAAFTLAPVRKTVTVVAPRERAFQIFTGRMSAWWPLTSHHIGAAVATAAVIEPFAGGRWFERDDDGSECNWGRVIAWEPPTRLLLDWQITADWRFDGELHTTVEVQFIALDDRHTRIDLEHRDLHAYGARAAEMQGGLDSPGGWTGLLAAFAAAT